MYDDSNSDDADIGDADVGDSGDQDSDGEEMKMWHHLRHHEMCRSSKNGTQLNTGFYLMVRSENFRVFKVNIGT